MLDTFTKKCLKLTLIISLTYITLKMISTLTTVILPFLLAYIFAKRLHSPCEQIHKRTHIPKPIIVTLFLTIIGTILYTIIHITINQSKTLAHKVPLMTKQVQHFYEFALFPLWKKLSFALNLPNDLSELISPESVQQLLMSESMRLFEQIGLVLSSVSYVATSLLVFIITLFMMTIHFPLIEKTIGQLMPTIFAKRVVKVKNNMQVTFFRLLKAQLILSLLTALISLIGFYFVRFEHPFIWAAIVFVIDFLPYIGAGTIFLPLILYHFLVGNIPSTIIIIVFYCIILIFRQIIEPKVVGASLGIHPLIVLFIVFATIHLLGMIGLFLIPIILIMVAAIHHANVLSDIWYYLHR